MGIDGTVATGSGLSVVFFGTYDSHRPRFRILRKGLELRGIKISECHIPVWGNLEDRSSLRGISGYLGPLVRWFITLPRLVYSYMRLPPHDAVIVPYLGQLDVLIAAMLGKTRKIPVVFDPYVSLYQTVVHDRGLLPEKSATAVVMKTLDSLALKVSDHVLTDTAAHAGFFVSGLGHDPQKGYVVPVGAETDLFHYSPMLQEGAKAKILFYGSMIPLHGIETIIRAATEFRFENSVAFTLVGQGQDYEKARNLSAALGTDGIIKWVDSIPYNRLAEEIAGASVCLGIFGTSQKALSVIPNKVYQALAVGRPVITADTPAMAEWFTDGENCLLVPPGDSKTLAAAIRRLVADRGLRNSLAGQGHKLFTEEFSPLRIGEKMETYLSDVVVRRKT